MDNAGLLVAGSGIRFSEAVRRVFEAVQDQQGLSASHILLFAVLSLALPKQVLEKDGADEDEAGLASHVSKDLPAKITSCIFEQRTLGTVSTLLHLTREQICCMRS